MATATLPTIPPKDGHHLGIILRLSDELLKTLSEMASLALSGESKKNIDLAAYAAMLLEVQVADFRARQIPSDFLVRPGNTPDPAPAVENIRRGRLTAADEEKVIASMLQGMKVDLCATRFHTSASTIRRVWKRRGPSPEVIQKVLFLHGKRYDEAGPGHSVQAIAKACGVSEAVASAIIANHRPLVPSSGAIHAHSPRPGGWERNIVSRTG